MELIFLIENNSKVYYQNASFINDTLSLVGDVKQVDENKFVNKITVSLFDYQKSIKNYNLLDISKCNNLSSLRYKFFKKRYVSKKSINQIEILSDCLVEMINEKSVILDSNVEIEEKKICSDDEKVNDIAEEDIKDVEVFEKGSQTITESKKEVQPFNIATYFIFYSLGVISGYILKRYRPFYYKL